MKIIDRYLLRQYLKSFLICFVSIAGLYFVFDAFTNLESFMAVADKQGGLPAVLLHYYACRLIPIFDITSRMLALVAAMFTVTWIQRHNEMTALMAAGLSRMRIIRPIILAAIALTIVAIANRELIMPRLAYELAQRPSDLRGDQGQRIQQSHHDYRTDIEIRGSATYANQSRIEQPSFTLQRPDLAAYGYQLAAANAYYHPPEGKRPGGYLLDAVQEPKDLDAKPSLPRGGMPILITRRDAADWLKPGQCFVVSDVTFDDLTTGPAMRQFASTRQLIADLRNPSLGPGADVRVTIHSRIVRPLLDIALLFLGLPLVVSRHSRNIFFAIGVCLAVVLVFIGVEMGCQQLGVNSWGVSPALSAWLPLILFGPMAVGMGDTMRE